MSLTDHAIMLLVELTQVAHRYIHGSGDIVGNESWHTPPGRPRDRLRFLMGNFLHVVLAARDPAWSATVDEDARGEPCALVLRAGPGRIEVIDFKISAELLRITLPNGTQRKLLFRDGGFPIAELLAEICVEFFYAAGRPTLPPDT